MQLGDSQLERGGEASGDCLDPLQRSRISEKYATHVDKGRSENTAEQWDEPIPRLVWMASSVNSTRNVEKSTKSVKKNYGEVRTNLVH